MLALLLVVPARATVPTDLDPQLENPAMSETSLESTVAAGGSWTQSAYELCDPPVWPITHPDIVYHTYTDIGLSLKMDEYDPAILGGQYFPAVVMVHGGGGFRGCKYMLNQHAYDMSLDVRSLFTQHFIAFVIDYRLACSKKDPNLNGSPIYPYCGWPYNTNDPEAPLDNVSHGPGIHDVEWAIDYVRLHANDFCHCWNGKIAMVGGSWGGNLAFMASYRLHAAGNTQDQVLAIGAWSGALEVQQQQSPPPPPFPWPCFSSQTDNALECGRGTNTYLGCPNILTYPDTACESPAPYGLYAEGSPYGFFGSGGPTGWPLAFFSNGGGGGAGNELQSLNSAKDFATWLSSQGCTRHPIRRLSTTSSASWTQTSTGPLTSTTRHARTRHRTSFRAW